MRLKLLLSGAAMLFAASAHAATLVTADRYLDVRTGRYVPNPAILVGDNGRIQAIGTHEDLMRTSALYSALASRLKTGTEEDEG